MEQHKTFRKSHLLGALFVLALVAVAGTAVGEELGKEWVTTRTWGGSGTMNTDPFLVKSENWRIHYWPEGETPFHIDVFTLDKSKQGEAATQAALVDARRSLKTSPGEKFLRIRAPDADWKIAVEQYLSVTEEWDLRQQGKAKDNMETQPIATWTGKDTVRTYTAVFEHNIWKITCRNAGDADLNVKVSSAENTNGNGSQNEGQESDDSSKPSAGETVLNATVDPGQTYIGWGYEEGRFDISVDAEQTEWKVEAEEVMR